LLVFFVLTFFFSVLLFIFDETLFDAVFFFLFFFHIELFTLFLFFMLFINFTRGFPNLASSFICDSILCSVAATGVTNDVLAVGVESEAEFWLTGIMYDPLYLPYKHRPV
jgi:hypothetical protein